MTQKITRRGVLSALSAAPFVACQGQDRPETFTASTHVARGTFAHGVASGDPTPTRVVLWTRITPTDHNAGPVNVTYEMSLSEDFAVLAASGTIKTSATRDWTVKIDVADLIPGQTYFYRFGAGTDISPVAQTKTLPEGKVESARFAVVSCANWQHGFFNAYDHISRRHDYDALLHLGDYFYEYGAEKAGDSKAASLSRLHEPRHEIITLDDYRIRHAQYRSDPSLQAVSLKMPLITIWDDHESANDSWKDGAENHNDGEGPWTDRKANALRAYYEWMPIREPQLGRLREEIFRSYDYGDLLTLVSIETRLLARSEPLIFENDTDDIHADADAYKRDILGDPSREMMGQAQLDFITDALKASKEAGKPWRMVANQVLMGRVLTTDMGPYIDEAAIDALAEDWPGVRDVVGLSKYNLPVYPDSWDGYPAARERLYGRLKAAGVEDILVVTGDSHEYWINDLTTETGDKMGVEIGTTSVSSETLIRYMGDATADYNLLITQVNSDVRYYNALHNGYVDLVFTSGKCEVTLVGIDTVMSRDYGAFDVATFTVKSEKKSLTVSHPKGLNLQQRALFSGLG